MWKTREIHQKLIVAGDFNPNTSIAFLKCNFNGKNIIQDEEFNGNGTRLKSFCRNKNLCISSTYFEYSTENWYTYYSLDKKTRKINDYVLTEQYEQVAKPSLDFDRDHVLLQTYLHTTMTPVSYTHLTLPTTSRV